MSQVKTSQAKGLYKSRLSRVVYFLSSQVASHQNRLDAKKHYYNYFVFKESE